MLSRRRFVEFATASGALALSPALSDATSPARSSAASGEPAASAPRSAARRILILGGTGFLGPHLVNEAVARGHTVSILTRGQREPGLFEEAFRHVEPLVGDRASPDGYAALRGRTWDVVIETSGYRHTWTEEAVRALRGNAGGYMYVSSTGVFWPYHATTIAEEGRILLRDDPPREQPTYGVMKALSERAVMAGFGARALIVRPGYIVGPGDASDRWTYWPVRIARGGEILVPGRRTDPVQYIDVRDLAAWMVTLAETDRGGTYNAVGPARRQTMAEFVYGVAATTSVPLTWTWIEDYAWLNAYPLRRGADGSASGLVYSVPWIMAEGDELGHMQIDGSRALAAGLTLRPLAETATDTLAWRQSDAVPAALRERPRYVMTAEQEAAMLQAWHAHMRTSPDARIPRG